MFISVVSFAAAGGAAASAGIALTEEGPNSEGRDGGRWFPGQRQRQKERKLREGTKEGRREEGRVGTGDPVLAPHACSRRRRHCHRHARAPSNLVLDAEGRNDRGNFLFSSGTAMAVWGIEKIESSGRAWSVGWVHCYLGKILQM